MFVNSAMNYEHAWTVLGIGNEELVKQILQPLCGSYSQLSVSLVGMAFGLNSVVETNLIRVAKPMLYNPLLQL